MTLDQIEAAGFCLTAQWRTKVTVADVPDGPGLYVFVSKGVVTYVGSALVSLHRRMESYARNQSRLGESAEKIRTPTRPVHKKLQEALGDGSGVSLFTLEIGAEERVYWATLPVNVILGSEAALILAISPPWNRRGRKTILDTEAVRGNEDEALAN